MTVFLSRADVLEMAERVGAVVGDYGLLDSAVGRPQSTVFGDDAYPSIWDKAAALLHSLAANQQFVDGNKRVAWIAARTFLLLNDTDVSVTPDEGEAFMVKVDHDSKWQDISAWLRDHELLFMPHQAEGRD